MAGEYLKKCDASIFNAIAKEKIRQNEHIELIASENFVSPAILEAAGSVLTNKYAEGYPQKRYYGGCENVDVIEQLAIDRAKQLFAAEHVNVQPHSGSQANFAVYSAVLKPGDKILTLSLQNGGHLTHGHPKNISGMLYNVFHYDVSPDSGYIDYDHMERIAKAEHPKLITIGASAYSRSINFELVAKIAHENGALLLADVAHIAGLIAAGLHQNPVPYCEFVTTTTHKTLRGPRGGMIMCKKEYARAIDAMLFPGTQGGPLMHIIAAKAVCFLEALQPSFKKYQLQVIKNAAALSRRMMENGYHIVTGGTDNHLMLVDLRTLHENITGNDAQILLEKANITTNKNTVPNETRSPFHASGLRLGTPAVTTRGMEEKEMVQIADLIALALSNAENQSIINKAKNRALEICAKFPLPY
ncbi:MAG: serine hydroxymethyltransferase [Puniceicoccales bacterium]|jgi:glycine hydroxymethyltransferase|nr:serine hydroxymethyltransferase [Puniceicoccales bacterium]